MPGWRSAQAPSWRYHRDNRKKFTYTQINSLGIRYGESYGLGDVVGCGVDFTKEIINYTKNGTRLRMYYSSFQSITMGLADIVLSSSRLS